MPKISKKQGRDNITLNVDWDVLVFYGDANIALIFSNLKFWIKHNEVNGRNFHQERHWTYNSARAFSEQFPFFSQFQIARMLRKLEKDKWIVSGNFNKLWKDQTKWYALGDRYNEK